MTEVTEGAIRVAIFGGLKFIAIQTDENAASGYQIDLDSDATDGRDAAMQEILNVITQDDVGLDFAIDGYLFGKRLRQWGHRW